MSGSKHKRPVAPIRPGSKPNAFLDKFQQQLEAQYIRNLYFQAEIDRVVLMEMLHDDFKIGPGRAKKYLDYFMGDKDDLATRVLTESQDDPEILVFKRDHAAKLKRIFGKDWETCREAFPYFRDYW